MIGGIKRIPINQAFQNRRPCLSHTRGPTDWGSDRNYFASMVDIFAYIKAHVENRYVEQGLNVRLL